VVSLDNSPSVFRDLQLRKEKEHVLFPSQNIREKRTQQRDVRRPKGGELSMSAFIVADKTINHIVNWLDRELEEVYGTIIIRQKLLELGFDASIPGWAEILGYEMFQLNIIAVDARYGSGEAKKCRPLNYRYKVTKPIPMPQVLLSLE
jgi:hypothetical protein